MNPFATTGRYETDTVELLNASKAYRIQSRWPQGARWRFVTAKPHGEWRPFDSVGLLFQDIDQARRALARMKTANAGDFRLVGENGEFPAP